MSTKRPLAFVALLFICFITASVIFVNQMNRRGYERAAVNSAKRYTSVLGAFRTTYTAQVVSEAKIHGLPLDHDSSDKRSIPLPVTMSMLIGEQLAKDERGLKFQLYSPYPFPWREKGGLKDDFERAAWRSFINDKERAHFEFQDSGEERLIRYAVADVIRPECVNCHNSHPESIKRDWKVGDVRGILEVSFPVEETGEDSALLGLFLFLSGSFVFVLLAIAVRRLRDQIEARQKSETKLAIEIEQAKHRVVEAKLSIIRKMAASIAHDFNNVLMLVLGYIDLSLKVTDDDLLKTYLQKSRSATVQAKILANKLPIAHDQTIIAPDRVNLNLAVRNTLDIFEPLNGTISMRVVAEETIEISASLDSIERMLLNILFNAAEAIDGHGEILIRLAIDKEATPPMAIIDIEDSGCGIEGDALEHLYDPFFTTKSTHDNAGLGLFTTKQIALQHKGAIELVKSSKKGTTFRVSLPVLIEDELSDTKLPQRQERKTLLIVEDEQNVRELYDVILSGANFRVTTAGDGEEAMEIFGERADDFDLILSDIRMPKMNGHELATAVRGLRPKQKVIFLSGYDYDEEKVKPQHDHIKYIKKPVSPEDLIVAVNTALQSRSEGQPLTI